MNTLKYLVFSLCSVLLLTTACTSDGGSSGKGQMKVDQLNGDWELTAATRDGQKTVSLEGTYMKFSGGEKMACNFIGEEINSNFTFKDNEITQGQQIYTVEELSETKLKVSTTLRGFNFTLTFSRAKK